MVLVIESVCHISLTHKKIIHSVLNTSNFITGSGENFNTRWRIRPLNIHEIFSLPGKYNEPYNKLRSAFISQQWLLSKLHI